MYFSPKSTVRLTHAPLSLKGRTVPQEERSCQHIPFTARCPCTQHIHRGYKLVTHAYPRIYTNTSRWMRWTHVYGRWNWSCPANSLQRAKTPKINTGLCKTTYCTYPYTELGNFIILLCCEKPDGLYQALRNRLFSVSHRMILSCWDEKKPSWVSLYVKI